MKLFLCSHFSSVGSLIKEEIENKKVAFIPTASLREGYTGYVGSARKLFKKLGVKIQRLFAKTNLKIRVCGAKQNNESPSGAFKRQNGLA